MTTLFVNSYYNDSLDNPYLETRIKEIGEELFKDNFNYIISKDGLNDIKNYIIGDNKKIIITKDNIIINYYINKSIKFNQYYFNHTYNIITSNNKKNAILDIRDYILQGFKIQNINDCKLKNIIS